MNCTFRFTHRVGSLLLLWAASLVEIVLWWVSPRAPHSSAFIPKRSNTTIPQTVYCWGSILERKGLATLTGRAPELCGWAPWLGSVARLCGWALSSSCPPFGRAPELCQLCGWAAPLNSVNSVVGLCGWALCQLCGSVAGPCPPLVLLTWPRPELFLLLSSSWLGSVAGLSNCPPLVLLLAPALNSINSVAGLCGCGPCPPLVLLT